MNSEAVRRSLVGALVGAVVFGGMSVYRSLLAEGSLFDYLGPIGMMAVIGGTVGGLVGPLIGEAWRRSREGRPRGSEAAEGGGGAERPTGGGVPSNEREMGPRRGASGGRQPFWFTLLVGAAVGWGVGIAWGRVWAGVALGLILALLARRAFR